MRLSRFGGHVWMLFGRALVSSGLESLGDGLERNSQGVEELLE
jgi:hypothetical protein